MDGCICSKSIKTSMWGHSNSFFFLFLIYIKCSTIPTHHFFQEIIPSFFWRAISPSIEILQETCSGHLGTLAGTSSSQASGVRCSLSESPWASWEQEGWVSAAATPCAWVPRKRAARSCITSTSRSAGIHTARQPRSPSLGPVARTQSKRASLLTPASRVQEV